MLPKKGYVLLIKVKTLVGLIAYKRADKEDFSTSQNMIRDFDASKTPPMNDASSQDSDSIRDSEMICITAIILVKTLNRYLLLSNKEKCPPNCIFHFKTQRDLVV